jgi:hypothetical protein
LIGPRTNGGETPPFLLRARKIYIDWPFTIALDGFRNGHRRARLVRQRRRDVAAPEGKRNPYDGKQRPKATGRAAVARRAGAG